MTAYAHYVRGGIADILNAVAWKHRGDGWGLSAKPSGNNVYSLRHEQFVAYDILHAIEVAFGTMPLTVLTAATAEESLRPPGIASR